VTSIASPLSTNTSYFIPAPNSHICFRMLSSVSVSISVNRIHTHGRQLPPAPPPCPRVEWGVALCCSLLRCLPLSFSAPVLSSFMDTVALSLPCLVPGSHVTVMMTMTMTMMPVHPSVCINEVKDTMEAQGDATCQDEKRRDETR